MEDWAEDEFDEMSLSDIVGLVQQYEQAQKEAKSLHLDEESYERIIQFYQENREFKRAVSVASSALERYPFSPGFFILKAESLAEQSHFDEALQALELAETLDATEITIFLIRADIYLWTGKHSDALVQLEKARSYAELPEDLTDIYLLQADIYEDLELYDNVMKALQNAAKADPQNEEALNRLWFSVEITSRFEESEKFHRTLIDDNPYNFLAWFNLGHALYNLDKTDEALEAFGYVTAIEESFDPALIFAGDIYFERKDFVKALELYMEGMRVNKPYKETFYKAAECYEQMHDFQKARYYLRKATVIDSDYDDAFFKIGETYMAEENYAQAVQAFERTIKIAPENSDYLAAAADAALLNEDPEKALEFLRKAIEIEPNNKLLYINLASAYFGMEDLENCVNTMTSTAKLFPNSADLYYINSVFLFQSGMRQEAFVSLQTALEMNIEEVNIIFQMDASLREDAEVQLLLEQYGL
ncbi:MAG TPA: tetratricopeptide repeat protein [Chitinophagales bacterium]